MPKDAFAIDCVITVNMMSPGTIKAPYDTPSTGIMRGPIADPNTIKYSIVEITGDANDCKGVLKVLAISKV
jgi:hypothetical protein